MSERPPRDVDWVPDDATGIEVPTTPTQNAGWLVEIPPRQFFNWLWNRCSRWFHYLSGQSQEWIVIDSANANEKDYDTLAAYIADSPIAGDKVLVKEDQTITVQTVIPDDITLKLLDGSRLLCATNIATSVLQFGSNIIIEGVLNVVLSQAGTTAKAVELNGDNVVGKINVENSSTGTLTTAYHINANKTGNRISGFVQNTSGGTLTTEISDNSTEASNLIIAFDEPNNTIKTNGTAFIDLLNDQAMLGIKTFFDNPVVTNAQPGYALLETGVSADNGRWDITAAGESLLIRAVNDDNDDRNNVVVISRTGIIVDKINFLSTLLQHNGVKVLIETDLPNGTYTPTSTGVNNIDTVGAIADGGHFSRTGNVVTMCASFLVDPTTIGIYTSFRFTPPIASAFTAQVDCSGSGASSVGTVSMNPVNVEADFANDEILVELFPASATANVVSITCVFVIK